MQLSPKCLAGDSLGLFTPGASAFNNADFCLGTQGVELVKADARMDLWSIPASVMQPCVATQTSALMKAMRRRRSKIFSGGQAEF